MISQSIKVLVIDDNAARAHDLEVILNFVGEEAVIVSSAQWQAQLEKTQQEKASFVCVLLGDTAQPMDQMIQAIYQWHTVLPIILVNQSAESFTLNDVSKGAVIFHVEYPTSYPNLLDTLHRAQIVHSQLQKPREPQQQREAKLFRSLVGSSRGIVKVRELMAQVADKEVNVLITGESGTGKEVVARNLHYHSQRRGKPFVPINCGAIPADLLESELFGHEKGAFTGAISSRPGRFELAQGGTLFLDEIGDMPIHMQVKILRVLQERTYERVGSTKTLTADVRIIAATHRNLEEAIEKGQFREDLYYRLNVFPIEMPALRERAEDIPLLLNELIARIESEKRGSVRFSSSAIMALCRHDWPGNVRELANLMERLVITHPYDVIGVNQLPKRFRHVAAEEENDYEALLPQQAEIAQLPSSASTTEELALLPVNGLDLKEYMGNLESNLIRQALDDCNGIVARAADKLKIRRTTLVEKMRKYDMMSGRKLDLSSSA